MRIGAFEIAEPVPELVNPHALTMVRPWVDVGSVVSIALARFERHLGVKEFGRLARPGNYFDFTRYRPTSRFTKGVRELTIPNSVINYSQSENGPDMIFFHLLEPHAYSEDYTDSVVEIFKQFGVKRYGRLGAMYDFVPHTRPVIVTGDLGGVPAKPGAGGLRQRTSKYQGPTSIMNLVSDGIAKLDDQIESMNFMVHVPQYLQLDEDYTGAARLLEVLGSIYDIPEDLPPFRRGRRQYRELDKAMATNPELKELVARMEERYDTEEVEPTEAPEDPALSSEVESFLAEMNQLFTDPDKEQSA